MSAHSEPKIIVAIDFGTTFSGVAFAYTDSPEDKEVISTWPGGGNGTSDKVPTEIFYDRMAPGGYKWGFDIKPGQKRHQWFKLLLDPSQVLTTKPSSLARKYPSKTELPPDYARDPTVYVTDYLTALRKHTTGTLIKRYTQKFVEDTPIEYILTIPAVWSDRARNKTFECARNAGMSSISCISEPEAAAVYTLNAIQPNHLKIGDNFIVCDAGGGTVDLITYKVTGLDPLQVEESVVGDGGLCGSTYLNRRFEEFLEEKIGVDVMARLQPRAKALMMKEFDGFIKRDFCDLSQQDEYIVNAPGIPETDTNGVQEGLLIITRAEVRKIFEPVISEVQDLVLSQICSVERAKGRIAAVLLVGGFGANEYLRRRLMMCVDAEVMQPKNAWTAVVRGALLRGLEGPLISHRQARRHYGIVYSSGFREGIDPESNKYWDYFRGEYKCRNRMRWYLKKGERVADTKAVSFKWRTSRDLSFDMSTQEVHIVCYEGKDNDDVPTYKNPDMFSFCTLEADLSSIPRRLFERKQSATPGHPDKYVFHYNLEMKVGSASISFTMSIDGDECGSVDMKFD